MAGFFRSAASVAALVGVPLLLASSSGCEGTAQVIQVFMALDATGQRPRDTFYPDTTVIDCDVVYSGANPDSTVIAQFLQTKGEPTLFDGSNNLQAVSYEWAALESAPQPGMQTLSFTLEPPQPVNGGNQLPFPVGDWECDVSVNGVHAATANFKIVYPTPDCPPSGAASPGDDCTGYMVNATCPSTGNTLNPTACTCGGGAAGARVWSCSQ